MRGANPEQGEIASRKDVPTGAKGHEVLAKCPRRTIRKQNAPYLAAAPVTRETETIKAEISSDLWRSRWLVNQNAMNALDHEAANKPLQAQRSSQCNGPRHYFFE
jgi:hypothetical protein